MLGVHILIQEHLAPFLLIQLLHVDSVVIIQYHSRDHTGVGMANRRISPQNQPQFSHLTIWQYWLGKTKPKKSLQINPKRFQQEATKFCKKFYLTEFSLTN